MKHGDIIECVGCGRTTKHYHRRLCQPCWRLHHSTNTLHWFPTVSGLRSAGRREDYAELRAQGESVEQAARRLGVCERQAWRYEAQLRQEAAA